MSGMTLIPSGSVLIVSDAELSGSTASYLFSDGGPYQTVNQAASFNLKNDVTDSSISNASGMGNVFAMSPADGVTNPKVVFMRTQLPKGCTHDWYINCEVQFGHADGSPQSNKFVQLSWAGRLNAYHTMMASNNINTAGNWTDGNNADFTANGVPPGSLKSPGWWPVGVTKSGNDYPILCESGSGTYSTARGRFVKLSEFVNSGEASGSFKQGEILDICLGRDINPTSNPLGVDIRIAAIKIRYTQVSGS
tara:strand:+ start:105 stop:854 length:750 start_codon:yes stop_codon:yes gene_type:complete